MTFPLLKATIRVSIKDPTKMIVAIIRFGSHMLLICLLNPTKNAVANNAMKFPTVYKMANETTWPNDKKRVDKRLTTKPATAHPINP
eukprot:CAMPEP_0204843614 /NCGR_PEP_ID=MMETSP1346-20131115/48080_1 /ASSEMBLY_ACC=CAM_ASM_000771 /TAXON_ID=215587 /ORGANISM="Aplanochytrium stocchinoi, Strain GSBS06" /LENGTH=86 /DNA_ID=CAMNT_0051982781 /DNA_START=1240 /DNA_END=1500 /DNA_ORIENTATION=+